LEKAILVEANLERANLEKAILIEANLARANLIKAILTEANLQEAVFRWSNLYKAKNVSLDQLSKVKTLFDAKLDEELLIPLKEKYPTLFEESDK
jgi:uncharacterized protein YjbI with pentapeptide repeats